MNIIVFVYSETVSFWCAGNFVSLHIQKQEIMYDYLLRLVYNNQTIAKHSTRESSIFIDPIGVVNC